MGIMAEAFKKAEKDKNNRNKERGEKKSDFYQKKGKQFEQKYNTRKDSVKKKSDGKTTYVNENTTMATSPYNFVCLPNMVVPSPLDRPTGEKYDWYAVGENENKEKEKRETFKKYVLTKGILSGKLELTFTTETPLFIGGTIIDDDENDFFYAPNGEPVIPGSTISGLVKNLLKIISCGAMRKDEDFYEHRLYFRDFRNFNYKKSMIYSKAKPGYLIRTNGEYFICPTQDEPVTSPDCNKDAAIDMLEDGSANIFTGNMKNKKTYMHIYMPNWNEERIPVPNEVIEEYHADKNRKGLNLFEHNKMESLKNKFNGDESIDFVVPCYYVAKYVKKQETKKDIEIKYVAHFGHGRYYRIAYENSIADHIPQDVQSDVIDFSDALFGVKELWAGRIYFEDAEIIPKNDKFLDRAFSHPLMTPKPTAFQLYLTPGEKGNAKHWDEETNIRGYKLYWHQNINERDWKKSLNELQIEKMRKIQPIAKNNCFKGNIRFSNLSEIELGALCTVFNLPMVKSENDIVYKLGRGKSIGMGSVRIHARLFIENMNKRYQNLFNENESNLRWNEELEGEDINKYCKAFNEYLNRYLGDAENPNRKKYEIGMCELRTMMDWKQIGNENWKEKTAMMNPTQGDTRLKNRVPLKDALSFVTARYKK